MLEYLSEPKVTLLQNFDTLKYTSVSKVLTHFVRDETINFDTLEYCSVSKVNMNIIFDTLNYLSASSLLLLLFDIYCCKH